MTTTKEIAPKKKTLPELLNDEGTIRRFEEMLGRDARSFQQNILTVYNGSKGIQECEPESIINSCAISASINLSILPSLGQSCIVPYKDEDGRLVAQWQMEWKGYVALAHRTHLYSKIHLARIYDGQIVHVSRIEGEFKFNENAKKSNNVIGYYFYFKLKGSDEKFAYYWSTKECVEHGLRYSKSFQKGRGRWTEDPEFDKAKTVKKWLAGDKHFLTEGSGADAMSAKTIVKNMLNKWAPLETRIKEIVQTNDQAVIGNDGKPTYVDTTAEPTEEAKTYTAPPMSKNSSDPTPADKLVWLRKAAKKQGVSNAQFDTWVSRQPGDEEAKASAAETAWKKVTDKKTKASEVFDLGNEPKEEKAEFSVSGVAKTEFFGEDAYVIRDTLEPPTKYYTDNESFYKAAKAAQEDEDVFSVMFIRKEHEKEIYLWITQLA